MNLVRDLDDINGDLLFRIRKHLYLILKLWMTKVNMKQIKSRSSLEKMSGNSSVQVKIWWICTLWGKRKNEEEREKKGKKKMKEKGSH